jgi:hypothetical protein
MVNIAKILKKQGCVLTPDGWSTEGDVNLSGLEITKLPKFAKVGGSFYCISCPELRSLDGAPDKVGRYFSCSSCPKLRSLEGAPDKVGGYFYCDHCPELRSLVGAPG